MALDFGEDNKLSLAGEMSPRIRITYAPEPGPGEELFLAPSHVDFGLAEDGSLGWCMVGWDESLGRHHRRERRLPFARISPVELPE